jgi:hypothetical protein
MKPNIRIGISGLAELDWSHADELGELNPVKAGGRKKRPDIHQHKML